jgi:hypothetical protein
VCFTPLHPPKISYSQTYPPSVIEQVPPPFSALWLYRFWQLVPLRVASELFAEWPLVPTTSGDLISCRLAAQVLRLTQDQCNQDLQVSPTHQSPTPS